MNDILIDILGDHYGPINADIKAGKHGGVISPKLHNNFDSWVYVEEEFRFQLRKNSLQDEDNVSNVNDMRNKLYEAARKYAEPRHLNCLSHIECLDFSDTQGAHILAGPKSCNYISFFGFPMGN